MVFYIFIYSLLAIILLFTLAIITGSNYINKIKNVSYSSSTIVNVLCLVLCILFFVSQDNEFIEVEKISEVLIYGLIPIIPAILCLSLKRKMNFRFVFSFIIIPVLFFLFSAFNIIFNIPFDLDVEKQKNLLFIISFAITSIYFIAWGSYNYWSHRDNDLKEKRYIMFISLLSIASLVLQGFFKEEFIVPISSTLIIVLTYMFNVEVSGEYDVMTQIRNRASYDAASSKFTKKSEYTIVMIDANRLKYVNDTFGHKKGDELIILVANAISKTFYRIGKTYRIGGDEFVVIIETNNFEKIKENCRKIVEKLRKSSIGIDYTPSVSWGLSTHEVDDKEEFAEVVKIADNNMYEMKQWIHKKMDNGEDPYEDEHDWAAKWHDRDYKLFDD